MASALTKAENIPLLIISALVVIANIIIWLLVFSKKSMRTFTNRFVCSLAVSDTLIGGVVLPANLAGVDPDIQAYIVCIALLTGVANVGIVTLDRYIAVIKPFQYETIMRKHFTKILVIAWSLAIGISLLPLIWSTNQSPDIYKTYIIFVQVLFVFLPYILIFIAYCRIFKQVREAVQRDKKLSVSVSANNQAINGDAAKNPRQRVSTSSERKIARLSIIIASTFLLTWLPVEYLTLTALAGQWQIIPDALPIISLYTIALGALVDPMVYSFIKPDFRRAIKDILRECLLKARKHEKTNVSYVSERRRESELNGTMSLQYRQSASDRLDY